MRVKIVATLGPASMNYETMKSMVHYGVRIFRLNFSHSDPTFFIPTIKTIRSLESELGIPLTVMGDLCGPKIRIGEIPNSPQTINKGATVTLGLPEHRDKAEALPYISLDMPELLKGLTPGMPVSLSDGMLQFEVTRAIKPDAMYEMEALNEGILTSNKGIAFPGKFHPMPAMTDKDRRDLHAGIDVGMNAVALSFVQNLDDVLDVKNEILRHGSKIPVVAKLERKNALDNLDAILAAADVVMVARGDLGLECSLVTLPVIQKRIIRACRHAQKASIVATQMLLSMVKNPIPTRAESTDVANAILDGADCVMLSEETAIGQYPVEACKLINGIAESAEQYFFERAQGPYPPKKEKDPAKHLAYAASLLADNMDSSAIVCHSLSGGSARLLSSRRPNTPIYALTPDPTVQRGMNFFFGVEPRPVDETTPSHLERAERFVQNSPDFKPGDNVVITAGQPTPGQAAAHYLKPFQENIRTNQIKIYFK